MTANFFTVYVDLPQPLVGLIKEYCDMSYCQHCNDYYSSHFVCLTCPHFTKFQTVFKSGIRNPEFDGPISSDLDGLAWNYIQCVTKRKYKLYGFSHTSYLFVIKRLKGKVTRQSRIWYYIRFYPMAKPLKNKCST